MSTWLLVMTLYAKSGEAIQTINADGFSTEKKCKEAQKTIFLQLSLKKTEFDGFQSNCFELDK